MTCRQLGGGCDMEFKAESFEEMAEQTQKHGMEMFQKQDPAHMAAVQEILGIMQDPMKMGMWMAEKRKLFEETPED